MGAKLGVFMSHPIQYQISLMRHLAKEKRIDLIVNFFWDFGIKESFDREFGGFVKWDLPLLTGYKSVFRKNFSPAPSTSYFGCINFGVIMPILKKEYDVVLIFGWALFSNWLVVLSAYFSRTPIILISETPFSHEQAKSGVRRRLRSVVLKALFLMVAKMLYIGKQNHRFYKYFGVPDSKLDFAPYGVDNVRHQKFQAKFNKNECAESAIKILFVGKLIEKKRPEDLLLAFGAINGVAKTKKNIELWFVGSGPKEPKLRQLVIDHSIEGVVFWGFQNQTKLPQFYAESDIFVLPSGYGETWGLVVNEAMLHGKPVIVSDLVGCGDDLVTNKNGFRVPFGNIEALSQALLVLVNQDKMRSDFGRQSKKIIKNFSQEVAAESIAQTTLLLSSGRPLND
ncbi:glycosyltransferase family 4 protein [bacterium]|nr:glycosyltransferase family 4 protein [bacterium]